MLRYNIYNATLQLLRRNPCVSVPILPPARGAEQQQQRRAGTWAALQEEICLPTSGWAGSDPGGEIC